MGIWAFLLRGIKRSQRDADHSPLLRRSEAIPPISHTPSQLGALFCSVVLGSYRSVYRIIPVPRNDVRHVVGLLVWGIGSVRCKASTYTLKHEHVINEDIISAMQVGFETTTLVSEP